MYQPQKIQEKPTTHTDLVGGFETYVPFKAVRTLDWEI